MWLLRWHYRQCILANVGGSIYPSPLEVIQRSKLQTGKYDTVSEAIYPTIKIIDDGQFLIKKGTIRITDQWSRNLPFESGSERAFYIRETGLSTSSITKQHTLCRWAKNCTGTGASMASTSLMNQASTLSRMRPSLMWVTLKSPAIVFPTGIISLPDGSFPPAESPAYFSSLILRALDQPEQNHTCDGQEVSSRALPGHIWWLQVGLPYGIDERSIDSSSTTTSRFWPMSGSLENERAYEVTFLFYMIESGKTWNQHSRLST